MSNFFTATLSGKGNKGDKGKSRTSTRTSASSSSASHATSPTDLSYSKPYEQHPSRALPTSIAHGGPTIVTPASNDDFSASSSSLELASRAGAEFGATSPGRLHASGLSPKMSNTSLSPRKASDNMSIRSVSSSMSTSTVQRPNDELGRYPSITRLQQAQGERLPNGSRAIPTTNSAPLSGPPSAYTSAYSTTQNTPPSHSASHTPPPHAPHAPSHTPPIHSSSHSSSTTHLPNNPTSYATTSSLAKGASTSPAPSNYAPSTYAASTYTPSIYTPSIASQSTTRLTDEFNFPRPSDEEVEQRFLELVRNRDLDHDHVSSPASSLSSRTTNSRGQRSSVQTISAGARATSTLSISTKWQMVEADARSRWDSARRQKQKEDEALKMGRGRKSAAAISRDSPEWFIRKVLDNQLNHQHLVTLGVSLRTFPLE